AVQHALGAEEVDALLIDDRAAPCAAVVTELIAILRGVLELPERLTGLALVGGEAAGVPLAVELEEAALADRRHGIAFADLLVPDDAQAALGPGREDALLGRDAVAGRAEEGRPVAAGLAGAQVLERRSRRIGRTRPTAEHPETGQQHERAHDRPRQET